MPMRGKTLMRPRMNASSKHQRGGERVHYQVQWEGFDAWSDTMEAKATLPTWVLEQLHSDSSADDK